MIDFLTLRSQLESSDAVLTKFKDEGEFSISAGDFASKVAPAFKLEKEAAALVKALGADAVVFRFRPRANGSAVVPITTTPSVFEGSEGAVVVAADLQKIDAEFIASRIGPGGYAIVKIGTVNVKVPMVVSEELRSDLISVRNDGQEGPKFAEEDGAPILEIESPTDGETIPTIKSLPQRDLPPWSDEVPRLSDLEVVEVLEPSRKFKSPRITVKLEDGSQLVGLICTQPIARSITGITEGDVVLDEKVIGQRFQIVDVEDRRRRDGELVKGENGEIQKSVIVRNTTAAASFSL